MPRVLLTDPIDDEAVALLAREAEVLQVPQGGDARLTELASGADGIIVRSGTRIAREVILSAPSLRVIGRAGVGVDNIDLEAATERGVWVVNAPDSNSVAVAEHVFALMLCLARRVLWAAESLARGEWRRASFRGEELNGKVLGIVGLGRIGRRVAERGRAFGMIVLAHDPFVAPAQAQAVGARLVPLAQLLRESDFVTLHLPSTTETDGLLGEEQLAACKPGAYLINCSRGSVVDEAALLRALDSGHLAGAGLDVFACEPPKDSPLVRHPAVVATPHIGGMTREAQRNVALAVAEQVLAVLQGRPPSHPVNAPALSPEEQERIGPYLDLARRLGRFYAAVAEHPVVSVEMCFAGQAVETGTTLITAAALQGLLEGVSDMPVNLVNARVAALSRGISVTETTSASASPYSELLSLTIRTDDGPHRLSGTILHGQPYIVRIEDFWITFIPAGTLLYTEHIEQPGILGRMGTLLGERNVNISFVQVGRSARGGRGVMILGIDDVLSQDDLGAVCQQPSVIRARLVRLPPVPSG
ncbi:MAG: phosphoglycerate dehydrogenase [Anaerolineae bacterium]|nr:phosphoglycerate dehydrogenase [Anaerolineae bacterium]